MIGYKAGLYSRQDLKQLGLWMFLGQASPHDLEDLARSFADKVLPHGITARAQSALDRDRAEGRVLVLVTAAMEFYAMEIARRIGFQHVIATRHTIDEEGDCRIAGGNCYGPAKVPRVEALLARLGLPRNAVTARFYSDSISDAPLLDWADEAVLVDPRPKGRKLAAARGWQVARFR